LSMSWGPYLLLIGAAAYGLALGLATFAHIVGL